MPPDRGRASKACTACHKQKTRCYPSGISGGPCIRCQRLHQPCSLDHPIIQQHRGSIAQEINDGATTNDRLGRLERIAQTVVERLDSLAPREGPSTGSASWPSPADRTVRDTPGTSLTQPVFTDATGGEEPSSVGSGAPVYVIRDVATEVGAGQHDQRIMNALSHEISPDIIDNGLLSSQDASSLLALFCEHYGRWVAIKETTSPEALLAEVKASPLLLCACCLIAVRHTTQDYASRLAPRLFQEAKALLSTALLVVPQSTAFFQAALVLSLWSSTIGQALLSVDSWLLSGFALQHCLSSDLFTPVTNMSQSSSLSRQEIHRWFIWNHLCLVHLHYCVGTRRKALLDRGQIENCRRILDFDHVTNFETRMVAEVNLYWIIYERCSPIAVNIPGTQALLNSWKQEWKFLFDQPRSQFVQMGFHFAQLLMYEKALKSRSAAVRESLLSEMVRLSAAILNLAMETADVRTRHLSDHIYHVITFAAVTLCRLLHMYEHQLARSHDIAELDQLVLNLVTWLHSIGLPCHVAHTLGDVVSAFHEKLRPDARPTPTFTEADLWAQDNLSFPFPEQLDTELFYSGNSTFFPDWEPFLQGPPS